MIAIQWFVQEKRLYDENTYALRYKQHVERYKPMYGAGKWFYATTKITWPQCVVIHIVFETRDVKFLFMGGGYD
jgi:hypothetical protein